MKQFRYFIVALSILTIVGCSSKGEVKPEDAAAQNTTTIINDGANTRGTDSSDINGDKLYDGSASGSVYMPTEKVVYFDYDQSDIRTGRDRSLVEEHAAYLAKNANVGARLEGHADERGSREYNLALGESRANTVKHMLSILGVSDEQMTVLSYGEESPAATGHDETSWQLNRRVEFVYP
jgi:peptidoglycan-associated lipoprotein